jgi:hypothetical protein
MTSGTIGRRQVLRGAGVAAGGAAIGTLGFAQPAAASGSDEVEGSWRVTRQDEGDDTKYTTVLSFAEGDVALARDISPAGPPLTGAWDDREDDRFRATLWGGFPGEGGPGSAGPTIRVRLRGKADDDRISGSYTFTVFAPNSEDELESGTGTFRGWRIHA